MIDRKRLRKVCLDPRHRKLEAVAEEARKRIILLEDVLREAKQYVLDWPIGVADDPQEQRGGPRDTMLANIREVLDTKETA